MTEIARAFRGTQLGSDAAFTDWVRRVEIPLRRSLQRYARFVDVEAVFQEGLLRIWKLAPSLHLEGENASLRYALTLMRNLACDEARRLKRASLVELKEIERLPEGRVEPDPAPDPRLRGIILGCLERLPRKPRAAMLARVREGHLLSDHALAEGLKMTTNTFLQNIVRARRLVAECLEGRGVHAGELR